MSNGNDCTGIVVQVMFEPFNRFGIEVVGRFVEQQNIGLTEQEAAQSHPAAFTTRQVFDQCILGRTSQSIHCAVQLIVEIPCIGMIEQFLQFALTDYQFIEISIGIGKLLINLVKFGQHIHHFLRSFLYNFFYSFVGVEHRFLFQIAYGVTGRENNLALK